MGVISKHGVSAGSLVSVVILGPVSVPAGQLHFITDFKSEMEGAAANGAFMLEKSLDNFVTNVVEVDRNEMPSPGTMEDTPRAVTKIVGGASVQWRVRLIQGAAGAASTTVRGETLNQDQSPSVQDVLD